MAITIYTICAFLWAFALVGTAIDASIPMPKIKRPRFKRKTYYEKLGEWVMRDLPPNPTVSKKWLERFGEDHYGSYRWKVEHYVNIPNRDTEYFEEAIINLDPPGRI